MNKKIFISILILLILFLGLVSVSAAEFDNGSDFTIDDMDKYSLAIGDSEFEDTLSIGKEIWLFLRNMLYHQKPLRNWMKSFLMRITIVLSS